MVFCAILLLFKSIALGKVKGSPHDLSAVASGDSCSFCHTPHMSMSQSPGWSHKLSNTVYKIYQSSSLEATVGQPTGSSKLCLSCHDGTVALTDKVKGVGKKSKRNVFIANGAANLGTDLSDDHPISFVYNNALAAKDSQIAIPSTIAEELKLDRANELQCTSCHSAHDNQYDNFLLLPNNRSQLCISCHNIKGWSSSSHESSEASVASSANPFLKQSGYETVAENACMSCHRAHSAGGAERLLHYEKSEDNCLTCHDGSVSKTNIKKELSKYSGHNVMKYNNIHDIRESVMASPEHVECVDCHNAHAIQDISAQAPLAAGSISKVSGVTASGGVVGEIQYEYELCFKCHADNPSRINSNISRQITQTNTRLEFDPSNPSYHPVVAAGANKDVPSLKASMAKTTLIYCTDCHSSNNTSGAKGPHGSNYEYLLKYRYETKDYTSEGDSVYELCYECHSRNSIINDESFPRHNQHLENQIPCSACHDPHGISSAQGNAENHTNLINFDITIVSENSLGDLEFEDTGDFEGKCSLKCHGIDHDDEVY